MSKANTPISSTPDSGMCHLCGMESICGGLGVVRYDVPMSDPRFGKLFRCPNHAVEMDTERHERLRRLSNMAALADKGFDNFEIQFPMYSDDQALSLQMAVRVASNFAEEPRGWLLLEGTYGCGKTHLAAAVGNERLRQGDTVLFITAPDLLDHLRSGYSSSAEEPYDEMFERVRNATLLILDDLGVENPSAWAQEKLFQLLNHRYTHKMPTVITTNASLDTLDPRIRSRLLDERHIRHAKISAPDYRTTSSRQQADLNTSLSLYAKMTFDTFDTEKLLLPDEQKKLERSKTIAQDYAKEPKGWLMLMGDYGGGKTHLAAAIAHEVAERGEKVLFVTVPDLLDYLRVTFRPDSSVSFDQRFQIVRNVPLLVMDDLGTEHASPWAREKLFQILDHRYIANLATVITTSKQLENMDDRIRTRLMDKRRCTIHAVIGPDYATRLSRR